MASTPATSDRLVGIVIEMEIKANATIGVTLSADNPPKISTLSPTSCFLGKLFVDDTILSINGQKISNLGEFFKAAKASGKLSFRIKRDEYYTYKVNPLPAPKHGTEAFEFEMNWKTGGMPIGIWVYYDTEKRVIVSMIESGTLASQTLKAGDQLTKVNDAAIMDIPMAKKMVFDSVIANNKFKLTVERQSGGPNAHFEYFKQWYDYVNDYTLVKKARTGYDGVKRSCSLAENTLNRAETEVSNGLTNVAAPFYANYCFPTTDKLVEYYTRGLNTTKTVVDKTVSVAVYTGAISLGLSIVAAQMGLIATTSATNAFLTSLIYTKNAGFVAIKGVHNLEKVVEQRIREVLEQTLAKVPADKIIEHTHTFLDMANVVFDRLLGLPLVQEPGDSPIADRIRFLSSRVTGGLLDQANNNVIDPVRSSLHEYVKQMNHHLILLDYIKKQREWASEKIETLSAGVAELKSKIEKEAQQYRISPEEMLVRSIRTTSALLNDNFETLGKQGNELIGERTLQTIESATHFVKQLDNNFSKAETLYQIRDEVIAEAQLKFNEMKKWTLSLLTIPEPNQQPIDPSSKVQPTVPSNSS